MNHLKITIALLALLVPSVLLASLATPAAKKPISAKYSCSVCHMEFTAAQAKADHYKDPMDGGTLIKMQTKTFVTHPHKSGMKSG